MAKSYGHLDQQERAFIETQLRFGMRPAVIAVGLMRARSTITREMRRNGWQPSPARARSGTQKIAGGYRCVSADRRARLLAIKPRVLRKLFPGNALWIVVADHLRQGFLSRDQFAGASNEVLSCRSSQFQACFAQDRPNDIFDRSHLVEHRATRNQK